ncbi:MAG: aldehyde dehydrogenase EutE [Defluviitaleaceae bacterium]|nr:aldehyde dehydrogenase EutE [Defluviitaleaceae bacterium]
MQQSDLIERIVTQVINELKTPANPAEYGIFPTMETAIAQAALAQKQVARLSMAMREKIIANIRKKTLENAGILSDMAVAETGMGNPLHKRAKHELLAAKTPGTEDISTIAFSGDNGLTLVEQGPFGVIGAITPCTNPSETVLCNTIGMLAAGNTVAFNPHPAAVRSSNYAVHLINQASFEAGGPENIAVSTQRPTQETGNILFNHPCIQLLVVTGGPGVVTAALKSGKRAIGAGAGNPPVLVDDTADIKQAAADIVAGATFDNNLPCIAEKGIVATQKIADELLHYLKQNGCYHANPHEVEKLCETVLEHKNGQTRLNRNCVGKSAEELLKMIGVTTNDKIECIIFEGNEEHILIREELMMPILGLVRAGSVEEGIRIAVALEQGNHHSVHMHSKNVDNLTRLGQEANTAVFVKNAPSYAALGYGGEGFCSFTIASRTGEGLTRASTFTKSRRCVMGESLCIR